MRPVLAHRAAFFKLVQSSIADTAMTCLRAEQRICGAAPAIAASRLQSMEPCEAALTKPEYSARGSNGPQDRGGERATVYDVSRVKLGLFGANCSSSRAIMLAPERWTGPR
jgi:hypothetical protein